MKLGLALSGGGILSAAHIGVIRALEESGLTIEAISGTSGGGIVAALYAADYGTNEMESLFCGFLQKAGKEKGVFASIVRTCRIAGWLFFTFVNGALKKGVMEGLFSGDHIEAECEQAMNAKKIKYMSELRIPAAITAVDLETGERQVFCSKPLPSGGDLVIEDGKVSEAVRATISIPVLFTPKTVGGRRLVDGGLRDNLPAGILRLMGCDTVISVKLLTENAYNGEIDTMPEIAMRSLDIFGMQTQVLGERLSDYMLNISTGNGKKADLSDCGRLVQLGYDQTKQSLDRILPVIALGGKKYMT